MMMIVNTKMLLLAEDGHLYQDGLMQHLILTVLIMEEGILETDLVLTKFLGTLSFAILK